MSELRDRIAAVITEGKVAGDGHGTIADAVIAELGLRREWGALDDEGNGTLADTREELVPVYGLETIKTRWITDWRDRIEEEGEGP